MIAQVEVSSHWPESLSEPLARVRVAIGRGMNYVIVSHSICTSESMPTSKIA